MTLLNADRIGYIGFGHLGKKLGMISERLKNDRTFLKGIGWLGASQLAVRVARLITTIVVARLLLPEHFGVAAIVLAVNEFSHVIARTGTTSRVVHARNKELDLVCTAAYWLNWKIGLALFAFQCIAGFVLADIYDNRLIILPLCYLAISYLVIPAAMVQCSLNLRNEKMDVVAKSETYQAIVDAALTVLLAFAGFGLWALIIPKLLVLPIWIKVHYAASSWRAKDESKVKGHINILDYTRRVTGVEIFNAFRLNIDYVLIGFFLGIPALGVYYFAYNAGLGLSRGFISVLNKALFPYLCATQDNRLLLQQRFATGIKLNLIVAIPIVLLQVVLAPWYVPFIFGDRWVELGAVPLLMLICPTGVPVALTEVFSQLLRAMGLPNKDLLWHAQYSTVFLFVVLVSIKFGLVGVAVGILVLQYIAIVAQYLLTIRPLVQAHQLVDNATFRSSL